MTSNKDPTESDTQDESVGWHLAAKCRMGKTRESILLALYRTDIDAARTATDFTRILQRSDYPAESPSTDAVSVALRRLAELGIMECKTPEVPHHRLYGLTEKGKQAVEKAFP